MSNLLRRLDNAYLQWALRSMHPLHPDMPLVFRQLNLQRPL
jgi:hypothetical protein